MAITRRQPGCSAWSRRRTLALALIPLSVPASVLAQDSVLVVSRRRMLNETRQARALQQAEQRMTAELQERIDKTKRELAEEEQELAELRSTLPRDDFEERTTAFDRKTRRERRKAQRHAAALQSAFRSFRVRLLEIMDRFLARVREERGAAVILDAENALAWDPAHDITDTVITRFNETVPRPDIPDLETILSGGAPEGE